jgi:D-glycero-D-manno-heptose 1,7-bisphosphate phosphatase
MTSLRPAVFLDRDGVVMEDGHYLADPALVRLIPGAAEAVAALNRAGWVIVVVTNQSGVARGLFPLETVLAVHDRLGGLLRGAGARVDGYYFCPHHPEADVAEFRVACECRKPRPGMLRRAAAELGLELSASWLVGDRVSDLGAGAAAGCRTVLVRTGHGSGVSVAALDRKALRLELVAADLAEAVEKVGPARAERAA